jgi:hypothetical protein
MIRTAKSISLSSLQVYPLLVFVNVFSHDIHLTRWFGAPKRRMRQRDLSVVVGQLSLFFHSGPLRVLSSEEK